MILRGLLTMGGEERDLVLRAREHGVQLVFDPGLVVPHHDSFLTLETFLERQERYSSAVVRIWRRHGVDSGYDARVRANLPPRLGADSPTNILKKLLRRMVASPGGFAVLRFGIRLAEASSAPQRLLWWLYDVALASAITRGVHQGLAQTMRPSEAPLHEQE